MLTSIWLWVVLAYGAIVLALVWRDEPGSMSRVDAGLTFAALLIEVFTFHTGLAAVGALVVALVLRARVTAMVVLGFALWALVPTAWYALGPRGSASEVADGAPTLTVLSANVLYGEADAAALARVIAEADADVVCLQEYTPAFHDRIEPLLRETYEHVVTWQREDAFGQATYSRLELVEPVRGAPTVGEWRAPQMTVVVEVGGERIAITNVHLFPPANRGYVQRQRQQIAWLGDDVKQRRTPGVERLILAGDFNAPVWTTHMRELRGAGIASAHEVAGERGWRGRGSTWPNLGLKSLAPGIRLDQVLFAGGLVCVESRVLGGVESDHRPVVATFVVE